MINAHPNFFLLSGRFGVLPTPSLAVTLTPTSLNDFKLNLILKMKVKHTETKNTCSVAVAEDNKILGF
jgi:hypothetical protein